MPGVLTHIILGKLMKDFISDPLFKSVIRSGIIYLQTGAVGPDLPYGGMADRDLFLTTDNSVADMIHHGRSNLMVLEGLHLIKRKKNISEEERNALFCFIMGIACHITADGIIHPFVNHKTGDYRDNKGEHRSFEFKLDVILLHDQKKLKLNKTMIHNELMQILLCQYKTDVFTLFCRLLKRIYGKRINPAKAEGWVKGLYNLCSAAEGKHLGVYRNLLGSYLIPEYNDIKNEVENISTASIPYIGEKVHFINDCIPRFFRVTVPLFEKAFNYIYLEGKELNEEDLPDTDLDTGREHGSSNEVPVFWK
jgi:hypothetical protein